MMRMAIFLATQRGRMNGMRLIVSLLSITLPSLIGQSSTTTDWVDAFALLKERTVSSRAQKRSYGLVQTSAKNGTRITRSKNVFFLTASKLTVQIISSSATISAAYVN